MPQEMTNRRSLFPPIEPFHQFHLKVSDIHDLYVEEAGNPKGQPILFLHGGPGGGISPSYRQYFDPEFYRIVLFDQRGAGKSTPHACLEENTTAHLVSDIEKIRTELGIQKWVVFGGSWGSTLSLAYAEAHPESVLGLILRGIFLCRKEEITWFYQFGAHHLFPDEWESYVAPIPEAERSDFVSAYYHFLTQGDEATKLKCAHAWSGWEANTLNLIKNSEIVSSMTEKQKAIALARIECHYFYHNAFFETDNQLLENIHRISHLPCKIVHGRYDVVTPFKNAWDLKKAYPKATLQIIPDSGHASNEPGIIDALVRATDEFKSLY